MGTIDDQNTVKDLFLNENSDLTSQLYKPMLCFVHNKWSQMVFFDLSAILVLFFFIGNTLLVILYRQIKLNQRKSMVKNMHKVHIMLFKGRFFIIFE